MNPILRDCLAGAISPEVAVAQMLCQGRAAAAIRAELEAAPPHPRAAAIGRLVAERAAEIDRLAALVIAEMGNQHAHAATPAEGILRIAGFFDRAVAAEPEASVALYSLGDPARLAQATDEIIRWLEARRLLGPGMDALDLGCGFGRVAAALAGRCRSVLGLDVSSGMVAEARRRLDGVANVRFERTGGEDLGALPDAAFDLVLAVDSFPYIVQAGDRVADRHVADAARIMRPGGALVILNLSYRQSAAMDLADARRWAADCGLLLVAAETRPFTLWDGSAYVLAR